MAASIAQLLTDPLQHYPAATVACFDPTCGDLPRRKLDHELTRLFLENLVQAGAEAVLIGASTGQGHLKTVRELEEFFAVAASANLGECLKMALLRPEDGPYDDSLFDCLLESDYRVVFVRPGTNLSPNASEDQIVNNLLPLVRKLSELGLAVGLYSIPDVSGMAMSSAVARRLVATEWGNSIVAIKVTEANYERSTLRFLQEPALSHLKIVQGWDTHLAQALQDGPKHHPAGKQRCGVTSGPMSFAIYQYLHIFAAAEQQDWVEVAAAQEAVSLVFRAMQDDPYKFADLQRMKFVMGLGHPMLSEVQASQTKRILSALSACPRASDRQRLARSMTLMPHGPFHEVLYSIAQGDSALEDDSE
jgi:dihydrodipicolinate synthase/N-acetylneuraminate lyase